MPNATLEQLYQRFAQRGDVNALAQIFDRVTPGLARLAGQLTGDESLVDDLVQETFLHVVERPETFDPSRKLMPWMMGILINHARNARRQQGRLFDAQRLSTRSTPEPDAEASFSEHQAAVSSALEELPDNLRLAVEAKLKGAENATIASDLGISRGALRVRLHRGLQRLRATLPPGLATLLAIALIHPRGLAHVRAHILKTARLKHAPATAGISASLTGISILTMKNSLLAIGALTLFWILGVAGYSALAPSAPLAERHLSPTLKPLESSISSHSLSTLPGVNEESERVPEAEPERAAGTIAPLRVLDTEDQPIAGAVVLTRRGTTSKRLGETDAAGELHDLSAAGTEVWDTLFAAHPAFATGSVYAGDLGKRESITMVLQSGSTIEGVVTDASTGKPVGAGVVVSGRTFVLALRDFRETLLAAQRSLVVPTTETDETGHFILGGLDAARTYSLVASTEGSYGEAHDRELAPGTTDAKIALVPLYGLLLEFDSPLGPSALPGAWTRQYISTRCFSLKGASKAGLSVLPDTIANLTGMRTNPAANDRHFYAFQPNEPRLEPGPLALELNLPGYKPKTVEVAASKLDRAFRATKISLEPLADGMGSIALAVVGFPGHLESAAADLGAGKLILGRPNAAPIKVGITFGMLQEHEPLTGFPNGTYTARFVGQLAFAHAPSGETSGKPTTVPFKIDGPNSPLVLDFSHLGSIELETRDFEGWPSLNRTGFVPGQRVERPGKPARYNVRGTLNLPQHSGEERPFLLVDPGTYQLTPESRVHFISPPETSPRDPSSYSPLEVTVGEGEALQLVWQTAAPMTAAELAEFKKRYAGKWTPSGRPK